MDSRIRDEIKRFFYNKDYDSKIGKNSDMLADELVAHLEWVMNQVYPKPPPKKDETVTIGGVTYTLEEIKK